MIGLRIDEPIDAATAKLRAAEVKNLGEIERGQGGNFVHFQDRMGTSCIFGKRRSGEGRPRISADERGLQLRRKEWV
jgi:hypothetical protein